MNRSIQNKSIELWRPALIAYGITLAAVFVASFFTETRLWGLSWYGYFGWTGRMVLLVVGIAVPLLISRWKDTNIEIADTTGPQNRIYWLLVTGIVGAFGSAFYLFRATTHFLGDGYQQLARLENSGAQIRPWNKGLYFIQDAVVDLLGGPTAESALLAFQIISYACGLIFLIVAAWASARLLSQTRLRILMFLSLATGGYMLLHFGYVEIYPPFLLVVTVFSLVGLVSLSDRLSRWWAIPPLLLAGTFHPYSVTLIPAAAYLFLQNTAFGHRLAALGRTARRTGVALIMLLGLAAFWYVYDHSYFLRFALVPLVENRFTIENYTLLSYQHLLDIINLLLLLVPGLALLIVSVVRYRRSLSFPEYRFLALLVLPPLLIVLMFDPKLGMPRDWDMFSFAGFPLALAIFFFLFDQRLKIKRRSAVAVLSITLGLLILGPRVISQVDAETSIALFDSYSQLDVFKNGPGRRIVVEYLIDKGEDAQAQQRMEAHLLVSPHERWNNLAQAKFDQGKMDEAAVLFRRTLKEAPTFAYAWANLGACLLRQKRYDSALAYLRIADGLNPYNPEAYKFLSLLYLETGDYERGEWYSRQAARLSADDLISRTNLLNLYRSQGRTEEYEELLLAIVAGDYATSRYFSMAAELYVGKRDFAKASEFLRQGLDRGMDTAYVIQMQEKFPALKVIR